MRGLIAGHLSPPMNLLVAFGSAVMLSLIPPLDPSFVAAPAVTEVSH
jgi:hypothetical protein